MLGTPKALGADIEGEAVSQRNARGPGEPEREGVGGKGKRNYG